MVGVFELVLEVPSKLLLAVVCNFTELVIKIVDDEVLISKIRFPDILAVPVTSSFSAEQDPEKVNVILTTSLPTVILHIAIDISEGLLDSGVTPIPINES